LHELAVQDLSRDDLLARWDEGTEEEFNTALNKVADFDKDAQKWVLRRNSWKELDVFEYNYAHDEDRQKAINNAIRWYDRMRLSSFDPLWQKLLPKSDRGKGICLSRLQAAIAKGPAVPAPKQRADGASASGGDSEKEGKGGEAMSRSSSQTSTGKKKLSASEAQAKRLLSTSKKKAAPATTTKAAPKTTTAKPAAKGASAKGARVLSKEFVSDSSSSDDEEPLSTSMGKTKASTAPAKPAQRAPEKPKAVEKTNEAFAPKPKPAAPGKAQPREQKPAKEQDTIRAQVIAKPIRPPAKRPRDGDEDDSSSSGTPLSKRVKPAAKPLPAPVGSAKARTASDASQNSRGPSQGGAAPKPKNTSPVKSSPLASSPPTNASDMEQDRPALARARERERERERNRDTAIRSSSSSNTDSSSVSVITAAAKKRPPPPSDDRLPGNNRAVKRHRPSQETIEMAARFKQFYARYQQLHHDISTHDNPDPGKVTDLLDMHERLSRMKTEIYAAVEA
jgi:RNA polymerase II elongation factor ELL